MADSAATRSEVEEIKDASRRLRGSLAESLENRVTGALADSDTQLSKFHGIYQQDDRDLRSERRQQKLEPAFSFMVRARVPGGICSPAQWRALDELSGRYADGTLRLTTRQSFQFHGIIKRRLKPTIAAINQCLLDTIAACGDVNRNVMCGVNADLSPAHREVYETAVALSAHFTPRSRAYHEIWLDGEKLVDSGREEEPIYGPTYLPRKFKIGLVIPPDNDVDVLTQDLGLIAILEEGRVVGYNVAVGGGMGATHGEPDTYPRLADLLGYCTAEQVTAVAEAVVTTQRDFGDRTNRKHARLKYTIDDRGLEWLRGEVQKRCGFVLEAPRPYEFRYRGDRFGWLRDADGLWHRNVYITAGRVADGRDGGLRSALREIAELDLGEFRLTPNQNLMVSRIDGRRKKRIDNILKRHSVVQPDSLTPLHTHALGCVALPTCGLAMAEAERYLPELLARVQTLLDRHGLGGEEIFLRITGCPNGCARPYAAEIGLVGKAPGLYNLMLGGDRLGTRLNSIYRESVSEEEILSILDPLLERFAADRHGDEGFGDYLQRSGVLEAQPLESGDA